MRFSDRVAAGSLLLAASVQFIFGMSLAEFLYPNYSVSQNFISDLGATCRGGACTVHQPSASIFNASVSLLGLLILGSAYYLHRAIGRASITILLGVTGIGGVGVGLLPETAGILHGIFSLITFIFAGLTVLSTALLVRGPLRYFGILMGLMSLTALALFLSGIHLSLGPGGMERMITTPTLLWAVSFGAHLAHTPEPAPREAVRG